MFVDNVSPDAANSLYDDLMSSIKSLSIFSNKHSEIQNLIIRGVKVRKMPIHNGKYIILYKVDKNIFEIYDIIDVRKIISYPKYKNTKEHGLITSSFSL